MLKIKIFTFSLSLTGIYFWNIGKIVKKNEINKKLKELNLQIQRKSSENLGIFLIKEKKFSEVKHFF